MFYAAVSMNEDECIEAVGEIDFFESEDQLSDATGLASLMARFVTD